MRRSMGGPLLGCDRPSIERCVGFGGRMVLVLDAGPICYQCRNAVTLLPWAGLPIRCRRPGNRIDRTERKSVEVGKSVEGSVGPGGRRTRETKYTSPDHSKHKAHTYQTITL